MGNGTSLGKVRALGSSHSGTHHWLLQRYTAIGNLLAGLFLLFGLLAKSDYSFSSIHDWLHAPLPATMAGLFVLSTFWHARLGLQVLVEDYVHEQANKFAVTAALNLLTFAGAAFGLLSVARIALGA